MRIFLSRSDFENEVFLAKDDLSIDEIESAAR